MYDRINPKRKIRPGKPLLHGPKSVLTHLPVSIEGSQLERIEVKLPKLSQNVLASKTASQPHVASSKMKMIEEPIKKNDVLSDYEQKYGSTIDSIVSIKRGKRISSYQKFLPKRHQLLRKCAMKPSIYKQYGVKKPQLNNIIVPVVKIIFKEDIIIKRLACVSKSYNAMIRDILAFADGKKDFTPLLYPRLNYESQTNIQQVKWR